MRGLMVAVIGMGVLIVAGVTVLVGTLIQRMSLPAAPIASSASPSVVDATLDEPVGTHVVGASLASDRLAVQLGGGGPDRVVIVDVRSGRIVGRVMLAR